MSGCVLPLERYHWPSAARNFTGDVETFDLACALSLPRGERPTPQTKMLGSTA
jgi:hypothetical protein